MRIRHLGSILIVLTIANVLMPQPAAAQTVLACGQVANGSIDAPLSWDIFTFNAEAGDVVTLVCLSSGTSFLDERVIAETISAFKTTETGYLSLDSSIGWASESESEAAGLSQSPLAAPRNLTANVMVSTVTLNWLAPASADAPTSYLIEAGSSTAATDIANLNTGNTLTTYTAIDVPQGIYYVRVRAVNAVGPGPPSPEIIVRVGPGSQPCIPPGVPRNLAYSINGFVLTLQWNPPVTGADPVLAYVIEAGSAAGLRNLWVFDTASTANTFSGGLPRPGVYYVRVRARNVCGNGEPSNDVSFSVGPSSISPVIAVSGGNTEDAEGFPGIFETARWLDFNVQSYRLPHWEAPGAAADYLAIEDQIETDVLRILARGDYAILLGHSHGATLILRVVYRIPAIMRLKIILVAVDRIRREYPIRQDIDITDIVPPGLIYAFHARQSGYLPVRGGPLIGVCASCEIDLTEQAARERDFARDIDSRDPRFTQNLHTYMDDSFVGRRWIFERLQELEPQLGIELAPKFTMFGVWDITLTGTARTRETGRVFQVNVPSRYLIHEYIEPGLRGRFIAYKGDGTVYPYTGEHNNGVIAVGISTATPECISFIGQFNTRLTGTSDEFETDFYEGLCIPAQQPGDSADQFSGRVKGSLTVRVPR